MAYPSTLRSDPAQAPLITQPPQSLDTPPYSSFSLRYLADPHKDVSAASAWARLKRHTLHFCDLHRQAVHSPGSPLSARTPWQSSSLAADLGRVPAVVAAALCSASSSTATTVNISTSRGLLRLPCWLEQLFEEAPDEALAVQTQVGLA